MAKNNSIAFGSEGLRTMWGKQAFAAAVKQPTEPSPATSSEGFADKACKSRCPASNKRSQTSELAKQATCPLMYTSRTADSITASDERASMCPFWRFLLRLV